MLLILNVLFKLQFHQLYNRMIVRFISCEDYMVTHIKYQAQCLEYYKYEINVNIYSFIFNLLFP